MTKLEKTIRGLECCIKRDPEDDLRCDACPYPDGSACANRLKIDALELLKEQKHTVDTVPVVRCKDCKYFIQTVFFGNKMNACLFHGSSTILPTARIVADDWYCADGERREDE